MNKWLRYFVKAFGIFAFCFVIASWLMASVLIAPAPSKVTWPTGSAYSPQKVTFQATDGINLKGWFLPQAKSTCAVVLLHGVRANRDSMLARAFWLRDLGYNVLLYDARGCGESDPAELSFGCHETRDLLGSLRWLQARGITKVACIGCSQGAATVLLASGELPGSVRAVVAEASYATLRDTVDDHFRVHTGLPGGYFGALAVPMAEWKLGLNMDDVSPLREISKLKVPVYLIGGTSDDLAPPAGTHQLYDAATCEKKLWMVPWAGHADFFSYAEAEYQQRIGDFLRSHLWP
jgi:pimeloyl-ACP methyl ester carboxylesterase